MKYNKGAGTMWTIIGILVVIGIALVAYNLGKNKNPMYYGNTNQGTNPLYDSGDKTTTTDSGNNNSVACNKNSPPSVTVLSPNGGEVYQVGQQIIVKWQSCNNPYIPKQVAIKLEGTNGAYTYLSKTNVNDPNKPWLGVSVSDTGIYSTTIPAFSDIAQSSTTNFLPGKNFRVRVGITPQEYNSYDDISDNLFTINTAQGSTASSTKTYSNSEYGISFSYPAAMTVNDMYAPDKFPGLLGLSTNNPQPPYDNLLIVILTPANKGYDSTPCDQGWDNNNFTHVTINNLDFIKGDSSSAFRSMNNKTDTATGYCYIAPNGTRYTLTDHGTPSSVIQNIIYSFTITTAKPLTTLPIPYISAQSGWPPVVQSGTSYSCVQMHSQDDAGSQTVQKTINGRDYCITESSDGALGSVYTTYTYKTPGKQGSTLYTTFTLRYANGCGAYSDPEYTECKTEQANFFNGLDTLIDSIIVSSDKYKVGY